MNLNNQINTKKIKLPSITYDNADNFQNNKILKKYVFHKRFAQYNLHEKLNIDTNKK